MFFEFSFEGAAARQPQRWGLPHLQTNNLLKAQILAFLVNAIPWLAAADRSHCIPQCLGGDTWQTVGWMKQVCRICKQDNSYVPALRFLCISSWWHGHFLMNNQRMQKTFFRRRLYTDCNWSAGNWLGFLAGTCSNYSRVEAPTPLDISIWLKVGEWKATVPGQPGWILRLPFIYIILYIFVLMD